MPRPKNAVPVMRQGVKLNDIDHKLVLRLADVEGRTLQGIVVLAVRAYAKRKAPGLLAEVYGPGVTV